MTVFKSDQCPYVDGAVKEMTEAAKQVNLPILVRDIKTCEEAQHNIHPYGTFCVLLDGKVIAYRPIGARGLLNLLSKTNSSCH